MMNRYETYFDANCTYYTTQTDEFLKSLGLFENLAFVHCKSRCFESIHVRKHLLVTL